ncbi:MAG: hypothetical protein NTY77_13430 [Elusimicrobia bacterium]|nr:hypothetical protein [Elusimicrobiota bacterium]
MNRGGLASAVGRRLAQQADLLLCLALFAFSLHVHWPGFITIDSITQLAQAQSGVYGDWHPALMRCVWHWLNKIHFGPAGMLVLHNLLFFGGLACLARASRFGRFGRAALVLGFTAVPSVFTQLGVVWKDVGLSTSYFLGASWLVLARSRRWPLWPALLPLFYGTAVRHNSLPALLPLALLFVDATRPALRSFWKKAAAGLALSLGLWMLALGLNRWLASGHREHMGAQLAFFDLAGISLCAQKPLYPPVLYREEVTLEKIRDRYHPGDWRPALLFAPRADLPGFDRAVSAYWLGQVFRHPACYLGHRLSAFKYTLNLDGGPPTIPICCRVFPNPWGIEKARGAAFSAVYGELWSIRNSLWFHVFPYYAACGLALVLALLWKDLVLGCLSASGFLYVLSYAVAGFGGVDFRYSYWAVIAALSCAAWLLPGSPGPAAQRLAALARQRLQAMRRGA